jgi:hypothetical protein
MSAERLFNGVGVLLTLGCVSAILAGNTEFVGRFEHAPLPLS